MQISNESKQHIDDAVDAIVASLKDNPEDWKRLVPGNCSTYIKHIQYNIEFWSDGSWINNPIKIDLNFFQKRKLNKAVKLWYKDCGNAQTDTDIEKHCEYITFRIP